LLAKKRKEGISMAQYSDALVELANQAWILNLALAELHGFKAAVECHVRSQPAIAGGLNCDLDGRLIPAIARLKTRQQALLDKWQRRIAEQSLGPADFTLGFESWGCRLELSSAVRRQLQVDPAVEMTLADVQRLAASQPEHLFTFTSLHPNPAVVIDDPGVVVRVTRFSGVDISVSKMWWSWWQGAPQLCCRLQAFGDNLWQSDSYAVAD
jgi:hypothetical protein